MKKPFILIFGLLFLVAFTSMAYTQSLKIKHSDEHVFFYEGEEVKVTNKEVKLISFKVSNNTLITIPVSQGKNGFVPGNGTNVRYNKDGDKVIVFDNSGLGFSIIDNKGNVIEEFNTVFEKHIQETAYHSIKEESPLIAHNPHWVGDYEIAYVSDADSKDGYTSVWLLDIRTKNTKKILDAKPLKSHFSIAITNDKKIYTLNHSTFNIHVLDIGDNSQELVETDGFVESFSPNGEFVVTRSIINGSLSSNIHILSLLDLTNNSVMLDNYRFNGMAQWSPNSQKIGYFAQEINTLEDVIVIYDTNSKQSQIITAIEDLKFDSINFSWQDNNKIVANMTDGSSWQIYINN